MIFKLIVFEKFKMLFWTFLFPVFLVPSLIFESSYIIVLAFEKLALNQIVFIFREYIMVLTASTPFSHKNDFEFLFFFL